MVNYNLDITVDLWEEKVTSMYKTHRIKKLNFMLCICQMTELARSQISGAVVAPPIASNSSLLDKQDELESLPSKHQQDPDR